MCLKRCMSKGIFYIKIAINRNLLEIDVDIFKFWNVNNKQKILRWLS